MTAAQLAASKGPVLQVPVDLGGVSVSYNVAVRRGRPHLTGPQIAEIYLRQITNWTPAIAARTQLPGQREHHPGVPVRHLGPRLRPRPVPDRHQPDVDGGHRHHVPSTTWPTAGRATGDSGEDLNAGVATYIQETAGGHRLRGVLLRPAGELHQRRAAEPRPARTSRPRSAPSPPPGRQATALSATNFNIIYGGRGPGLSAGQLQLGPHLPEAGQHQHRHRAGQALPVGHHDGAELLVGPGVRAPARQCGDPGPPDAARTADLERIADLHQLIVATGGP